MDKPPVLSEGAIFKLVKLVEEKPEIWNNSCNRDNDRRRKAWIAILYQFYPYWDVIPNDRQMILAKTYMGKWKNLRDNFVRSTRLKQPYKYHDILKFLLTNLDSNKQFSPGPAAQAGPSYEPTSAERKLKRREGEKIASKQKRMKTASVQTSEPPEGDARQQLLHPETTSIPTRSVHSAAESHQDSESVVDGDESGKHFFKSIKDMIKNFSETQELDFQIRILNVIKDIKNSSPTLFTNCKQEFPFSDSDADSNSE